MPDDDVRRLIDQARAEAREDVRAILRKRFAAEMLEQAERELSPAPALSGSGLWVYAIADRDAPDTPARGVDGSGVRAVRTDELTAFVSDVPLGRFSADALAAQLEDLPRVEALARAHEGVVEALMEQSSVMPCRLCTIYEGEASLREMLAREQATLADTLDRLRDSAEWGVKVIRTEQPAPRAAEPASGADYIAAKRDARLEAERAREALEAVASEVHAQLTEHADGAMVNRPQDRRLSGHDGEMLLNAAYLVPRTRTAEFRAVVEELAEQHDDAGLTFQLTGPWAPYHFAGEVPAQ